MKLPILIFMYCSTLDIIHCRNLKDDPVVETSTGLIRGSTEVTRFLTKKFHSFQAIPYAQPPVGKLRFRDPEPVKHWSGILDATQEPKECLQPLIQKNDMSEDCLYLNIFTPELNSNESLPVIFWIHGGFFVVGSGRKSNNNPELFMEQDVVFVSINYRLGPFGYLSADDEILTGNYGVKDQILALKWVQENIAKFGGNPNKVTVMGQSAGAANTGLLLQTSGASNLFNSVIMESGNSLNLWARTKDPTVIIKKIADIFDIRYNTTEELLEKMQEIQDFSLLFSAISVEALDATVSNPANGFLLGPTFGNNSGILTENSHEALKNGRFNRVPVLTGFNSGEANMFLPYYNFLRVFAETYVLNPSKLAPINLNVNQTTILKNIGKLIKKFYFGRKLTVSKQQFTDFVNDDQFIRPAVEFVRLISKYTDTYFYEFSYVRDGENRDIQGASHGEELRYIFPGFNETNLNEKDLTIRKRLVKLWTNFAKYNNPTPEIDELFQNITWKSARPDSMNYLKIDENLEMLENPKKESMNFWKSIYETYGIPPFDTY